VKKTHPSLNSLRKVRILHNAIISHFRRKYLKVSWYAISLTGKHETYHVEISCVDGWWLHTQLI
jgi:hypothetical protein